MYKKKGITYVIDKIRNLLGRGLKHFILIMICISILFPIYFMVITAFKTHDHYLNKIWSPAWPPVFSGFTKAFKGQFITWITNSIIITSGSVLLATFLASLLAFALAKLPFKGKEGLLGSIVSLMVVPPAVIIIPIFVLWSKIGLVNNRFGAIIVYTGMILPFSVYLLTNFFKTVPDEIIESAVIDGCTTFQIFRIIVLRLSIPALFTNVIVNTIWVWNELFIAMILLQSNKLKTLMVGLAVFKTHYNVNIPVIMAGLLISILPMVVLYLSGQNVLIKGLITGYKKG